MPTHEQIYARATDCAQIASEKGWDPTTWDNFLAKLFLVWTEVEEAEEAVIRHEEMDEFADIAIRVMTIVVRLMPPEGRFYLAEHHAEWAPADIFKALRGHLRQAGEMYRRGLDDGALAKTWLVVVDLDAWCRSCSRDLWAAIDKKTEINRSRPRLHGKKRSVG
jgi:hypothetical protein